MTELEKRIAGVKPFEAIDIGNEIATGNGTRKFYRAKDFEALRRAFEKRGEQVRYYRQEFWNENQVPQRIITKDDAEVLAAWEGKT